MPHPMLFVLLALAIAGCHHQKDQAASRESANPAAVTSPTPATKPYATQAVPFRTVLQGVHIMYDGAAENAVIRSQADWEGFLSRHPHNDPGTIQLDFAREQGVLVQLGAQPTGAIRVEIVSIEEEPSRFVVQAVRRLPASDAAVTDDIGYPTHYVAMARSDKPVTFAPIVDQRAGR